MNILQKLTLKDLKLNKKRTLGTIIGVMLSCALILVVGGFFFILQDTLIAQEINNDGYYHIRVDELSDKKVQEIKSNRDFSDVKVVNKIGIASSGSSLDTYGIREDNVYSYDKETFDLLSYDVIDGKFPKDSTEILVDRAYKYYSDAEVGDTIELNIDGVTKSYKISGISDRYSEFITTGVDTETYKAFITLKNPNDYFDVINEFLGVDNFKETYESPIYGTNYSIRLSLLMYESLSFDGSGFEIIASIFLVVIFVIMVTSIFAIRNSFAISVSEKTKMYGMLSSVGATKKQIKKMVLFEGLVVGLIGTIIGILFGIFVTWFLTFIINFIAVNASLFEDTKLVYSFSFLPVIVAILMSIIVVYLSVISGARKASKTSPIQNIRNSQDIKGKKISTPKIINKIFGIGGVISYKNLKRSKKKYRVTIISLTVSIFIFIVASSLIDFALKIVNYEYLDINYNVSINENFLKKNLEELRNLDNSYVAYNIYRNEYKIADSSHINDKLIYTYELNGEKFEDLFYEFTLYDDQTYKKVMKDLNLDYDYMKDKIIILNKIRNYNVDKDDNRRFINVSDYKNGDIIEFVNDYQEDKEPIKLVIGEVLTEKYPVGVERRMQSNVLVFLGNKKYIHFDSTDDDYISIYYNSDDPYALAKKINEIDSKIYVENIQDNISKTKSLILILSIVSYGFIAVLTLIGVTSVFNTINSNMELRKSEFATLKSVGMTKKEFKRMINLESLFYSFKSLFYGIILGSIGSYVVFRLFTDEYGFSYTLPFKSIILATVFIIFIVLIIMRYSIKKINKHNIIETIRNNNV